MKVYVVLDQYGGLYGVYSTQEKAKVSADRVNYQVWRVVVDRNGEEDSISPIF